MRLYHSPGSRSSRVLWTLEEIGCPYELTIMTLAERRSDAHRNRHPLGRVPVLEFDDGQLLFESAAICLQLADLYPDAGLIPEVGTSRRGLVYQWTAFALAELEPALRGLITAVRSGEDQSAHAARLALVVSALCDNLERTAWIAGDRFTVADILYASMLGTPARNGLLSKSPALVDYVERALARPASRRADAISE